MPLVVAAGEARSDWKEAESSSESIEEHMVSRRSPTARPRLEWILMEAEEAECLRCDLLVQLKECLKSLPMNSLMTLWLGGGDPNLLHCNQI